MQLRNILLIAGLAAVLSAPAQAKGPRSGAAFAFTSGTAASEAMPQDLDFSGWTVFGKIGFTDHWGLLISFRDMGDDEDLLFGEEDSYTQFALHAVYMWRHGKVVRPHVKFGVAYTNAEARIGQRSLSDEDTNISVGGGLEVGSEFVAFFGDIDYTEAEFYGADFEYANMNLGVIFKF